MRNALRQVSTIRGVIFDVFHIPFVPFQAGDRDKRIVPAPDKEHRWLPYDFLS